MIPISGFNPAILRSHLQSAAESLQSAANAIPEDKVELPPKPDGVILDGGSVFVAVECRAPRVRDYYMGRSGAVCRRSCNDPLEFHNGLRWILARRPDTPPEGQMWDEENSHGKLTKGQSGVSVNDMTPIVVTWEANGPSTRDYWRCKPIPKPSAYEKAFHAYFKPIKGDGVPVGRLMDFGAGWDAALDAVITKWDANLNACTPAIIASLREPVK